MKTTVLISALFFITGVAFGQKKSTTTVYQSNTKAKATVIQNSKGGTDVVINQSTKTNTKPSGNYGKVKMAPKKKNRWEKVKMTPKKQGVKMGKPKKGSVIDQ